MINETLKQLNKDLSQFISQKWAEEHNPKISLLARWIPREKSQFGWLFNVWQNNSLINILYQQKKTVSNLQKRSVIQNSEKRLMR